MFLKKHREKKKKKKTFCCCEKSLQRGISAVLTTVRFVLKKTLSFRDGFLVEVLPKKTEEAICMKMSRAMSKGFQYQHRGDVVKSPAL